LLGGLQELRLDGQQLLRSSHPVELVLDWVAGKVEMQVRGTIPATVSLAPSLGGKTEGHILPPGDHAFPLLLPRRDGFRAVLDALPETPSRVPPTPASDGAGAVNVVELWRKQVQTQPAEMVRPFRIDTEQAPETMALHNLHDGVLWSSSIPAPVWRVPELVLTLTSPPDTPSITGLRLVGNVGRIEIEEEREPGQYTRLSTEETSETLFAGYLPLWWFRVQDFSSRKCRFC